MSGAMLASGNPTPPDPSAPAALRRSRAIVLAVVTAFAAGLMAYALTRSFVWDEGFHLIAAQLINRGKTPYLDFCFPQPPLNAYWNAAWLRAFGHTWWVPHIPAALEVAGAIYLTADFFFSRWPLAEWRLPCTILCTVFLGAASITFQFGPIAQAYACSLLLLVAGFRVTLAAVERRSLLLACAAALLSSAAAGCTLLSAPAVPVLLIWMLLQNSPRTRIASALAFVIGAAIPWIPVILWFVRSPKQVWFNIVAYQALFRRVNWGEATEHDVDVLLSWVNSGQALFVGLLAIAGVLFIAKTTVFDARHRRELYLCGWLALALTAYISTAHPTFERYYIVAFPFYAVLAAAGAFLAGGRLFGSRPYLTCVLLSCFFLIALGKRIFDLRTGESWQEYQSVAAKVKQVTPPGASIFADELIYFLLDRNPPPGMEFSYSHKLELSPADEKLYHIVSQKELKARLKAGDFYTAQSCNDDHIQQLGLDDDFRHSADIEDCTVYWGPVAKPELKHP
jgi:hypothetical protein